MPQFAHLSDPHLTPLHDVSVRNLLGKRALGYLSWQRRRKHRHLPALLERVSDDMRAWQPEHIAVTGDLTQIGLPAEHLLAQQWLRRLGPPERVSLSPGNHDFYGKDSARTLYAAWAGYLHGADGWPHRRDCGELSFISLNSGTPSGAAFATGTVGAAQLRRLADTLRAAAGRCRVVLVHHSPHRASHAWRKRLTDATGLRQVLAAEGAELVLHGHAHSASLVWLEDGGRRIPVLGAPSASLRSSDPVHRAGYHRVAIERTADGWRADIETRQCVGAGIETTGTHALSLPAR